MTAEPEIWVVYIRDDFDEPDCIAIYTNEIDALRYANKLHYGTVVEINPGDFAEQIKAMWAQSDAEWKAERERKRNLEKCDGQ